MATWLSHDGHEDERENNGRDTERKGVADMVTGGSLTDVVSAERLAASHFRLLTPYLAPTIAETTLMVVPLRRPCRSKIVVAAQCS